MNYCACDNAVQSCVWPLPKNVPLYTWHKTKTVASLLKLAWSFKLLAYPLSVFITLSWVNDCRSGQWQVHVACHSRLVCVVKTQFTLCLVTVTVGVANEWVQTCSAEHLDTCKVYSTHKNVYSFLWQSLTSSSMYMWSVPWCHCHEFKRARSIWTYTELYGQIIGTFYEF